MTILTDSDLRDTEALAFLAEQESVDVGWGTAHAQDFEDLMRNGSRIVGDRLPWDDYQDKMGFAPGELTVHGGMNRHRKSMVLGQLAAWFALQGSRVGVMSFEMPIAVTMRRMCCQMAGSPNPGQEWWQKWLAWNEPRICYYDKRDTTPANRVLAAVGVMAQHYGCKHVVIDSFTKCGLPTDNRGNILATAAKDFIDVLTDTARRYDTHIHMVCHVRKPDSQGDKYVPNRYDIRGAGEISDLAHNVVMHWANIGKKRILDRCERTGEEPTDKQKEITDKPCQLFIVDKYRNGAWDGTIGLTFDKSMQFHRGRKLRPNLA